MGISGLLPLLKDIHNTKHLSEFRGQTLAVDAYVWLHRGTYGCAAEIATGKKTSKYVEYAMHRVRLLRHHGIAPFLVFDGGPLPAKKGTEAERRARRAEALARANALAAQGEHARARDCYVKCVDVTPQMAYQLIKALRVEGVPYVVAPYEADAQLAYLERIGLVDGIMTEDSDLLVFGCKNVLFKLDPAAATVTHISRADFAAVASADGGGSGLSLLGWSDAQFRTMAILSGCDYLPSIPGIGLKTAWALLRKHRTVENMVDALRLEGKKKVPKGYLDAFRRAERVFMHQRVYDPAQECLVYLTPLPEDEVQSCRWGEEDEAYVGA
ncbi:PIN domain-like protein [Dichomitus squalens]|uniref:PIN domain-like protein n=1 Tax=Dichomitus squalens TaxID=114155 RepID=A0A4Q9N1E2_9APHY|nr:PIN domain-like protein [Dichomitus squalens]